MWSNLKAMANITGEGNIQNTSPSSSSIDKEEDQSTRMRATGRWAMGSFVLVILAASEVSGIGTIAALPIAAFVAYLGAFCDGDLTTYALITKTPRRFRASRHSGDVFEYLGVWSDLLAQLTAAATCARIVSATMDYMSAGRTSDWLMGYRSHSLGEPWPDVIGVTAIVIVTCMFMLGLENSITFLIILIVSVIGSITFFIILGSMHADLEFWKHDRFLPEGIVGMFTTAALCSFGFMDVFAESKQKNRYVRPNRKLLAILFVQILSYILLTVLFTLMSHFRELTGTAVPMIRIFEARDVAWARPAMAALTIVGLSVALMEFCPAMYELIISLASRDWRALSNSLAYENDTTSSPVLAIFTAGSLSAILAFACPLSYLVRLLSVGPLLKHIFQAMAVLYYRYQPEIIVKEVPVCTNIEYSRLGQGTSKAKGEHKDMSIWKHKMKVSHWLLPKSFRMSRAAAMNEATLEKKNYKKNASSEQEEREYLLMGTYSPEPQEPHTSSMHHSESNMDLHSDSDSEGNDVTTMTVKSTDSEDDSSTDIDAVVQEYKERLKVATTLTGPSLSTIKVPSLASGRFVLGATVTLCLWSGLSAFGILFEKNTFIGVGLSGVLALTLMIATQPQINHEFKFNQPIRYTKSHTFYRMRKEFIPIIPAMAITINMILASTLMLEIWLGVILWIGAGLVLFLRCDQCCDFWDCNTSALNIRERIHMRAPPRGSIVSTLIPNHQCLSEESARRITHVDTILITR